jgi:hypothetical protein
MCKFLELESTKLFPRSSHDAFFFLHLWHIKSKVTNNLTCSHLHKYIWFMQFTRKTQLFWASLQSSGPQSLFLLTCISMTNKDIFSLVCYDHTSFSLCFTTPLWSKSSLLALPIKHWLIVRATKAGNQTMTHRKMAFVFFSW